MRLLIFALILLLPAALYAQDDSMAAMTSTASASSDPVAADQAFMASMQGMMQAMKQPLTSDADRDFTSLMIAHHQAAVDMAGTELRYGKDKDLRKLARSIIKTQNKEIDQMRKGQVKHAASVAPPAK